MTQFSKYPSVTSMGPNDLFLIDTYPIGPSSTKIITKQNAFRQIYYNVKDFGAQGDGVTDDTAAILAAIAALPLEGGVIFFPHGIYLISSTITILKHGVVLLGETFSSIFADQVNQQPGMKGDTVIKCNTSTWASGQHAIVFGLLGTNQMWTGGGVYNLVVEGTKGFITTGDGIQVLNVQAVRLINNNITGFSNGIYVGSDQGGGISNVILEHNILNSFNKYGIYMAAGSEQNYARFNYIVGYTGYGIRMSGIGNTVMNNHIEGGQTSGSGTADGAAIYSDGAYAFMYANDMMVGTPTYGIYASGSHTLINSNEMTNVNSNAVANGSGIWIDGGPTDVLVTSNAIADTNNRMVYGIRDTTSTGGVNVQANNITGYTTAPTISNLGFANIAFPGLISPVKATTAGAPAYVKGAVYFDTTLNKLRIGGASGWETVTSS